MAPEQPQTMTNEVSGKHEFPEREGLEQHKLEHDSEYEPPRASPQHYTTEERQPQAEQRMSPQMRKQREFEEQSTIDPDQPQPAGQAKEEEEEEEPGVHRFRSELKGEDSDVDAPEEKAGFR